MPSLLHEALISLFRNRPSLAPEMLKQSFDAKLPNYDSIQTQGSDLNQVTSTEYKADLVVLLEKGKPMLAIVVEVQLTRDPEKRMSWPVYLTTLRERLGCPSCLLVVCVNDSLAQWYSEPIQIGQPGFTLIPYILRPKSIPFVTDIEQAKKSPELVVLSVIAHGKSGKTEKLTEMVLVGQEATSELDDERALFYNDLMMIALSEAARKALEKIMSEGTYEYQSDFAKKYYGKGIAEGKAEGKAEGNVEGKISSLFVILSARNIELSDEMKNRITSCNDSQKLDLWIQKAATASSIDEIF